MSLLSFWDHFRFDRKGEVMAVGGTDVAGGGFWMQEEGKMQDLHAVFLRIEMLLSKSEM
jgi:hypothetical protein